MACQWLRRLISLTIRSIGSTSFLVPRRIRILEWVSESVCISIERLRFTPEGNFGLGTGAGVPYRLSLPNVATFAGVGIAYQWLAYSSRRWKTDIQTLQNPLEKIMRLRGVSYRPKSGGNQQIGFIAEEVGEVIPEVVAWDSNGVDATGMDYARLVPLLLEGMKEQQRQIEELKATIKSMER